MSAITRRVPNSGDGTLLPWTDQPLRTDLPRQGGGIQARDERGRWTVKPGEAPPAKQLEAIVGRQSRAAEDWTPVAAAPGAAIFERRREG
jgi:hypothetical protein